METTHAVLGFGALLFIMLGIASAVIIATATLASLLGAACNVVYNHPQLARLRALR